jgi:hypothetical protein
MGAASPTGAGATVERLTAPLTSPRQSACRPLDSPRWPGGPPCRHQSGAADRRSTKEGHHEERTQVAFVAAALLSGLAAPALAGAAGNDRFVLAGTVSGGVTIAERVT